MGVIIFFEKGLDKGGHKIYFYAAKLFRGSSMVEHAAVNRRVASSSLARGAKGSKEYTSPFDLKEQFSF